jgi:hypothetical protein
MSAVPPIAPKFYAPQRKTPNAKTGLVQRSKIASLDYLIGEQLH